MTILQLNTSINSADGHSSRLAEQFVTAWRDTHSGTDVVVRDLATDPIPHLDALRFGAFVRKADERTSEEQAIVEFSDRLIDELRRADVIVIGLPMYNFGIPSTLKTYFDHVARAGVTFRYTPQGPQGLLTGKRAYIFATRGGIYAGTARDSQTAYMRDFLAFLGIEQVEFVYAEGLALGEEHRTAALGAAREAIAEYAAEDLLAA